MLYRSMSDTNKPFVSVARKRGNELCYLTRSSSSSSSVNPCSFGDFYLLFVQDFSFSSPVLSRGRTQLVSGKHCLGICFDSNVKLPWLAPQRRSFSFSSHSHAYLSSLPSQVWLFLSPSFLLIRSVSTLDISFVDQFLCWSNPKFCRWKHSFCTLKVSIWNLSVSNFPR